MYVAATPRNVIYKTADVFTVMREAQCHQKSMTVKYQLPESFAGCVAEDSSLQRRLRHLDC
jgi:hypothetical protein